MVAVSTRQRLSVRAPYRPFLLLIALFIVLNSFVVQAHSTSISTMHKNGTVINWMS